MRKFRFLASLLFAMLLLPSVVKAQCDELDCYLVFTGTDVYGDGWNGAFVSISQDGQQVGTFEVFGASSTDTIRVCSGVDIILTWNSGMYDSECAFTCTDSLGVEICHVNSGTAISGAFATAVPCANCLPPVNLHDTVAWDGVYFTWDGTSGNYLYQVTTSSVPGDDWLSTTANEASVTELNANTQYHFFLKSDCGDELSSTVTRVFRTACGPITLPYFENFENADQQVPFCWHLYEHWAEDPYGWGSITINPMIYNYSYYAHSGNQSLRMSGQYGSNSVMSPRIPISANDLEVTFWAKTTAYDPLDVLVGYVTTIDSASAEFHLVKSVTLNGDYTLYSVAFDTVSTTDSIYAVLRMPYNGSYDEIYIDDLTLRMLNNCPIPQNLRVAGTASEEITLAWDDSLGTSWQVAYGPMGFDPDVESSCTYVNATSNPFLLQDLSNDTTYDYYVRTNCSGNFSYWSQKISARPNIYIMNKSLDSIASCGVVIADDGDVTGNYSSNTSYTLIVNPADPDSAVALYGYVHLDSYGYTELKIYDGVGTDGRLIQTVTGSNTLVDVMSNTGSLTLTFYATYYTASGFELQVSCVERSNCPDPYDLNVSNITGNSAVLSWTCDPSTEPQGFVITATDTLTDQVVTVEPDGDARTAILSGLSQTTEYIVELQAICELDNSRSIYTTFVTPCLVGGEMFVGDQNSTQTTSAVPYNTNYEYATSQQIIEATEFTGTFDSVYGIKFYNNSNVTLNNNIDIYMDTTSRSSYTSFNDFILQDSSTLVFSGAITLHQGWTEITFDRPFYYEGGNIVVTVDNNSGTYGSYCYFQATQFPEIKSVYAQSYSVNGDPSDLSTFSPATCYKYTSGYRDNMKLVTPCQDASCVPPSITSATATSHEAVVSWIPGQDETSWSVEYSEAGSGTWTVAVPSTSDYTTTITGLLPATTYIIKVSSLCSDEGVPSSVSVTTACDAFSTYPYVQDFESFQATSNDETTQMCYARHNLYPDWGYTTVYPYVYAYYSRSGMNSLSFDSYGSFIVFPDFTVPVDSLSLSLSLFGPSPNYDTYQLILGTVSSLTDTNFIPFDTITYTGNGSNYTTGINDWQDFYMELDGVNTTNRHLAFRAYTFLYIDDVVIDRIKPCKMISNPQFVSNTENSVTFTWTAPALASSYVVYYGTNNDIASADSIVVTTNTVTVSGLPSATRYHFWVKADCGTEGQSRILECPIMATGCSVIPVTIQQPYINDFELGELDVCYMQSNIEGSAEWQVSSYDSYGNPPTYANSGTKAMYIKNGNSSADATTNRITLPVFDFSALSNGAELSFQRFIPANDQASKLAICYRTAPTEDWIVVDSFVNATSSWTATYVDLPNSTNAAHYELSFLAYGVNTYGVHIDDIDIHTSPACARPTIVDVHAGDETAVIRWEGSSSNYQLQWRENDSWSWHIVNTTADSVVLHHLEPLVRYEVRLRSVCGIQRSEWSDVVSFSTEVCYARNEAENFHAGETATVSDKGFAYPFNQYSYSETLIDSADLSSIEYDLTAMAFKTHKATGSDALGNVKIWIGHTTASSMSAFQFDTNFALVYEGPISYNSIGWQNLLFNQPFTWDGHRNLVVAVLNDYTYYYNASDSIVMDAHQHAANMTAYANRSYNPIDPLTVNNLSSGIKQFTNISPDFKLYACIPTCDEPEITGVVRTENSLELSWAAEGFSFQVAIKEQNAASWQDSINTNLRSYTFTGLNTATTYELRVRQNCTMQGVGFSDWVSTVATTDTACLIPTNLRMVEATDHTATLDWNPAFFENRWEIHIFNNTMDESFEVNAHPAQVVGLTQGMNYKASVRAICSSEKIGEWSDTIQFNNTCDAVTNVKAQVHNNTALITWTPGANNTNLWEVEYGEMGFPAGQGHLVTSEEAQLQLNNLAEEETYDLYVRAICGEDHTGSWSNVCRFTTFKVNGIDGVEANVNFTIYPNPTASAAQITVMGINGNVSLEVVDMNGRIVENTLMECDGNCVKTVNVEGLAQGAYFVRISGEGFNSIKKLIVK